MAAAPLNTDLLTPLAAYLRLREASRASFLLESVDRGRLGRASWLGTGTRIVDLGEAEALDLPVVGYLSYEAAAGFEPSVPVPAAGRNLPESRFVVVETLVRFDHGAGVAEVLVGDADEVARRLEGDLVAQSHEVPFAAAPLRRLPDRATYESWVRTCQEHIRAGDVYQAVPSQRAERPTSASVLELEKLALIGSSPERLVSCEDGRASVCPIAGTTHPGDGEAERLLASEKD